MRKRLPKRPDDMVDTPPIPCDFKVGDAVTFTNSYGVKFDLWVHGFAREPHNKEFPDSPQRFIYVFTDAWWFPEAAETLQHRKTPEGEGMW